MAATGHIDAASISNALAASDALAAVAGLAVAEPTRGQLRSISR